MSAQTIKQIEKLMAREAKNDERNLQRAQQEVQKAEKALTKGTKELDKAQRAVEKAAKDEAKTAAAIHKAEKKYKSTVEDRQKSDRKLADQRSNEQSLIVDIQKRYDQFDQVHASYDHRERDRIHQVQDRQGGSPTIAAPSTEAQAAVPPGGLTS